MRRALSSISRWTLVPAFFVFDFVVFFDLLRAVIVKLSTRKGSRTRSHYRANHHRSSKTACGLSVNEPDNDVNRGRQAASAP